MDRKRRRKRAVLLEWCHNFSKKKKELAEHRREKETSIDLTTFIARGFTQSKEHMWWKKIGNELKFLCLVLLKKVQLFHLNFWVCRKFFHFSKSFQPRFRTTPKFLIYCRLYFLKIRFWEVESGSESVRLLERQAENSTSGWASFWERYPLASCFSPSAFGNVRVTALENVRICWFKRNLSNLDRSPKMRDSFLLISGIVS